MTPILKNVCILFDILYELHTIRVVFYTHKMSELIVFFFQTYKESEIIF